MRNSAYGKKDIYRIRQEGLQHRSPSSNPANRVVGRETFLGSCVDYHDYGSSRYVQTAEQNIPRAIDEIGSPTTVLFAVAALAEPTHTSFSAVSEPEPSFNSKVTTGHAESCNAFVYFN